MSNQRKRTLSPINDFKKPPMESEVVTTDRGSNKKFMKYATSHSPFMDKTFIISNADLEMQPGPDWFLFDGNMLSKPIPPKFVYTT